MKGNIKKLTVLVVIVTIAMFISAAMASAGGKNDWKAIHGQYAATSTVACNTYIADSTVGQGVMAQQSIYTFNGDGTGTVQGKTSGVTFSPSPKEAFSVMSWDFTYAVADDGTMTMDAVPGTGVWWNPENGAIYYTYTGGTFSDSGRFSVDHKTITVGTVVPNLTELSIPNGPVLLTKCVASRILIRVGEGEDEDE